MKTVIEMAREAGGMDGWGIGSKPSDPELSSDTFVFDLEDLERLVELVRADEREACAKVCEDQMTKWPFGVREQVCAAAIRARGGNT